MYVYLSIIVITLYIPSARHHVSTSYFWDPLF